MSATHSIAIRNASWIYSGNAKRPLIEKGYICIEGQSISAMGMEPLTGVHAEIEVDATGMIVTPGLINVHHHFFQGLTRALPFTDGCSLWDWLVRLYPLWSQLNPDLMYAACRAVAAELVLTGCTTSADLSYVLPGDSLALLDAEVTAARDVGLRLHLSRGALTQLEGDVARRLDKEWGFEASNVQESEDEALMGSRAAIGAFHDTSPFAMCKVACGPSAIPFDRPEFLKKLVAISDEAQVGLHSHFHPRKADVELCQRQYGLRPLEFLDSIGWLTNRTWLAHCTEITEADLDIFTRSGASIAHCPRCLMRVGYAVPPVEQALRVGVPVGIGTDGGAGNDSSSFLGELRTGLLLHRVPRVSGDIPPETWLTADDILQMATRIGAQIIGRDDIGVLEVGKAADIAAFSLRKIGYAGAIHDPVAGLLMAGDDTRADYTIVNGELVVRGGRLVAANEERLVNETNDASLALMRLAERNTGIAYRRHQLA